LESVSLANSEEKTDPSKPSRTSKAQKKRVSYFNHKVTVLTSSILRILKILGVFLGQKGCP